MKGVCQAPQHQETMKAQCSRTCGFCQVDAATPIGIPNPMSANTTAPAPAPAPANTCVDLAKNCGTRLNLCNHPVYVDYMAKYCKKTCGKCDEKPVTSSLCMDKNHRCPSWIAKGFCTNAYYTVDYRKNNCAKSCGLC